MCMDKVNSNNAELVSFTSWRETAPLTQKMGVSV